MPSHGVRRDVAELRSTPLRRPEPPRHADRGSFGSAIEPLHELVHLVDEAQLVKRSRIAKSQGMRGPGLRIASWCNAITAVSPTVRCSSHRLDQPKEPQRLRHKPALASDAQRHEVGDQRLIATVRPRRFQDIGIGSILTCGKATILGRDPQMSAVLPVQKAAEDPRAVEAR